MMEKPEFGESHDHAIFVGGLDHLVIYSFVQNSRNNVSEVTDSIRSVSLIHLSQKEVLDHAARDFRNSVRAKDR